MVPVVVVDVEVVEVEAADCTSGPAEEDHGNKQL